MNTIFLRLQYRLSSVNVVFTFIASHNDVAPVSPISFTVHLIRMEQSELLVDAICVVSFVLTAQIKFCECCV